MRSARKVYMYSNSAKICEERANGNEIAAMPVTAYY